MGLRFNPAPGWPPPPPGFVPPPHWQPDPSWPPAPPGWQLWVDDDAPDPRPATGPQPRTGAPDPRSAVDPRRATGPQAWAGAPDPRSAVDPRRATGPQTWAGAPDPRSATDPRRATGPQTWAGGAATGAFPADPAGVQARPGDFGRGAADVPPWADDFGAGAADAPPWAGDFGAGPADAPPWAGDFGTGPAAAAPWAGDMTGPQTAALRGGPTQAYPPGSAGSQGRYDPRDPFGGPGPGGRPPGRSGSAPPGRANTLAVASFVLGILGITVIGAIVSVVLGFMALGQIRRTGQRGRGLAIAGLALSALWLVLIGAYFVLHGNSPAQPPAAGGQGSSPTPGASSSSGTLSTNVFSLRPGQCFQNPPASQTVLGVTYVTVVPCTTAHNAQVFVQFNATGTGYPGVLALKRQAETGCRSRIKQNVQTSKIKNTMTLHYLYPLQSSWTSGRKTISCLIVNSKTNLTTSLLRSHPAKH